MVKIRQPQHMAALLTVRALMLANAAARAFNTLAAERALAQRAATMAAVPRERLAEVRALYTAQDESLSG